MPGRKQPEAGGDPAGFPEIDPVGKFLDLHIPRSLASDPNVDHGAKLTYGFARLLYGTTAGDRKQECFVNTATIAQAVSSTVKSVERWLHQLRQRGYIRTRKRARGVEITFLAQPRLKSSLLKKHANDPSYMREYWSEDPSPIRDQELRDPSKREVEIPHQCPRDPSKRASTYKEEKEFEKEIEKESRSIVDPPSHKSTTSGQEWWLSEAGEDPLWQIAQATLRGARAACFSEGPDGQAKALQMVATPDKRITTEICALFECQADFEQWTDDTIRKGLGRKAKSDGYALYRTDAEMYVEGLKSNRKAERAEQEAHDSKCKGVSLVSSPERFCGKELQVVTGVACSACAVRRGITAEQIDAAVERYVARDPEKRISALESRSRPRYFCDTCADTGRSDLWKGPPCEQCDKGRALAEQERQTRERMQANERDKYCFTTQTDEWLEIARRQDEDIRTRMMGSGDLCTKFGLMTTEDRAVYLALIREGHHPAIKRALKACKTCGGRGNLSVSPWVPCGTCNPHSDGSKWPETRSAAIQ